MNIDNTMKGIVAGFIAIGAFTLLQAAVNWVAQRITARRNARPS